MIHRQVDGERVYIVVQPGSKEGWTWPCKKCGGIRCGFKRHNHGCEDLELNDAYWKAITDNTERLLADAQRHKFSDEENEKVAKAVIEKVEEVESDAVSF